MELFASEHSTKERVGGCKAIKAIRVPGLAIEYALDSFASLLMTSSEYIFELAWDGLMSLISNAFDLLCSTATGSAGLTASAVVELVEKAKIVGEGLAELFPEVFEGLSGTVGEMAKAIWSSS